MIDGAQGGWVGREGKGYGRYFGLSNVYISASLTAGVRNPKVYYLQGNRRERAGPGLCIYHMGLKEERGGKVGGWVEDRGASHSWYVFFVSFFPFLFCGEGG